jgi:hypothetical protein
MSGQFGTIGSSDRSVASERDFSVSPRDDDLNFSTPPLLLPSDLLASSPAAPPYLDTCKLLAKSPNNKRNRRGRRTRSQKQSESEQFPQPGPSHATISPLLIPQPSTSTAKSPESSNVANILSNMFSAARSTGGVIKASTPGIEQPNELKPTFYAEIEESISNEKSTAATSETTINKYALSGTDSVDSDQKIYETVYDNENEQR